MTPLEVLTFLAIAGAAIFLVSLLMTMLIYWLGLEP